MTYTPNGNHPWRRYKDKMERELDVKEVRMKVPVKVFVLEIVENWENIQITDSYEYEKKFIGDLSAARQAAFLIGLLKKAYGGKEHEYE